MDHATEEKRKALTARLLALREGDQAAFEALLSDYTPLIHAAVARCGEGLGEQDREDLRQLASVALYRAALAFDLAQCEVEFGLYAKVCISNALSSHLRALRRRVPEVSVDALPDEAAAEDPVRKILEDEAYAALYARVRALLSPYENRVWSLYLAGRSARQIAVALGKDAHSVENAVYRIRRKLQNALGENGERS